NENGTLAIDATATDPVGRGLSYSATTPAHGTLSGTAPQYTYTPDPDYVGTDTFMITVSNGVRSIDIPVFITVEFVNKIPVAADQTVGTPVDMPVAFTLHATDADSTSLSYEVVGQPAH